MADGLTLNAGSGGATLATDDVGGTHYQIVKQAFGALDAATLVTTSNPLPVDIRAENASVTVDNGGTFVVQVDGDALTALQLIDDLVLAEDAVHSSGAAGVMPLAVRNDALAALGGADGDYAPLQVDAEGALYTVDKSLVDSNNSSTSTLLGDAVFTGTGTDVQHYASVVINVEASHNSATDGLQFQFSSDNTNWDVSSDFSYVAADGGISYAIPIEARYFRVVYTNGSTGQTHFRLQSILHANAILPTDGRLSDNVSPEKRGTITKSAIIAQASGSGNFVPIQATAGGTLKISLEEAEGMAGQATMANSIPVVIASNQTAVTVDLGANNDVTIDNSSIVHAEDAAHNTGDAGIMPLAVRNDTLAALGGTDGDYAPLQVNASGALFIQEGAALDVSAATVTVAGTGTLAVQVDGDALTALQLIDNIVLAEDAAHQTGDSGVMALAVRQDSQSDFGADGDYVPFSVDANGALRVTGGGGGTEYSEDVATPATIVGTATLMERDDALSSVTPIEGDWIGLRGTAEGALWVQDFNSDAILADTANMDTNLGTVAGAVSGTEMQVDVVAALPAGTNAIGKLAANSGVDIGDVDVLSIVPGTGATNLGKAEDAAHSTGDVGVMSLGVRDTAPAAVSGTDGDYEPVHINDDGGLWATLTPSHQGGNSFFSSIDLDESEEQVSATACTVAYMYFWNATAAPLWAQLFNATAASIAPGSDAPDLNFPIPANADADVAGVTIPIPQGGIQFGTALSVAVTTGSGTNSGAPGANEAGAIIIYKN